jgi:integrase
VTPPPPAALSSLRSASTVTSEHVLGAVIEPWPQTLLDCAAVGELAYRLPVGSQRPQARRTRRWAAKRLLGWLDGHPGGSWQERWEASGCEQLGRDWLRVPAEATCPDASAPLAARTMVTAIGALLCTGVLRPGYRWLLACRFQETYRHARELADPEFFADARQHWQAAGHRGAHQVAALNHCSRLLLHTGRGPRQLTPADLLAYDVAVRERGRGAVALGPVWDLLVAAGVFPDGTGSLHAARLRGPLSVAELVDRYQLACRPVRDLLVRYLAERAPGLDYNSLCGLTATLAGAFWKDLEDHHPGIGSLHLPAEVAQAWKQRAVDRRQAGRAGQPRDNRYWVLFAVRGFYLDIAQWAAEDPSWAAWAAPCPVRAEDVRGAGKQQRHVRARMHQRTRTLAPLLPRLVQSVEQRLAVVERLCAAAAATPVGGEFEVDGERYERILSQADRRHAQGQHRVGLRARRLATGEPLALEREEDRAFWTWAVIQTLRHTGVRVEELLELTPLALATYTPPGSGEVVPLLQVAPSKQDTERLLLVSPELAHVLARIIHRVRGGAEQVPLVARYDPYERVMGPPLPHLFQRHHGTERRVMSRFSINILLDQAVQQAALRGPDGELVRYTPHDFRRIFATELVAGGLPVHIAAKILGHHSLAVTERYVAVYDHDVMSRHRAFVAQRRAQRPSEEYREPTAAEWAEFEQHFSRRKVELGTCARPYGTPCRHEHACIRCPMLHPDPLQEPRLRQIIANLEDRVGEATERGWLGEVDGLQASLASARQKLEQMRKLLGQPPVVLVGAPTIWRPRR